MQRDFATIFPLLARHRPVVTLDFASREPRSGRPLHLDELVEQVNAVLDAVLPGCSPVVLGQSLGAAVALALAGRQPSIRAVVLISGWLTAAKSVQIYNALCQQSAALNPQMLSQLASLTQVSPAFLNATAPERLEALLQPEDPAFQREQLQLLAGLDLQAAAEHVKVPALVVAGRDDPLSGPQQSELLLGAISGARYAEISTGHLVSAERPAELCMVLDRFLRTLITGQEPHREPPRNQANLFEGALS